MTRLLHIVDSLQPSDVTEQLTVLATGLSRVGFDMHVGAFQDGPYAAVLQSAGVSVHVLPRRMALDPYTLSRLKEHVCAIRPDVVQTWLFEANLHGRLAAWDAGVRRLVAVERNFDAKRWWQWRLDRRLARRTPCIVATTPLVRDYYEARHVQPQQYAIIADAVPTPRAAAPTKAELLDELELPSDACLIGVSAPLRTESRIKDLIWGLDVLKWIYPAVQLLIIGDGPQRRPLMRYVDCVEVADCVHFLGRREDTTQLISCLDFLWHAATRDGAALPVLQAQWCGVPAVALDAPLYRGLISPGETGLLSNGDDRSSFARATHCLLQDDVLRQRIAQSAQQRVQQLVTPERYVKDYCQLYASLT